MRPGGILIILIIILVHFTTMRGDIHYTQIGACSSTNSRKVQFLFEGNKQIIDGNFTGARAVPGDPGEDGRAGARTAARGARRRRRG